MIQNAKKNHVFSKDQSEPELICFGGFPLDFVYTFTRVFSTYIHNIRILLCQLHVGHLV